ncbi:MAG: AmmeMemoRadiSam system radical SAM enzyme [Acidobacteria bacterium]|nr:AmmeMemoRadiSam system radical SAM enzyme [Acidobacteriota bacterium]
MRPIDPARRLVLRGLAAGGCAACLAPGRLLAQDAATGPAIPLTEPTGLAATKARWWKALPDEWIECGLCAKKCKLPHEERGACGVRVNLHGEYYTLVHSRVASIHLDPIEKKPFYHVLPGTSALSLAAPGCNYECRFCQNWEIAQARPEQVTTHPVTPAELVKLARRYEAPTIACTYTEPVVWSEFVHDIAAAAKPAGVRTLVITNGSWLEEPLKDLAPLLGAVKVDLKAFTESFYKELCSGELKPVRETLARLAKHGLWTEIVVLVIPGRNDAEAEVRQLARFVRDEIGPDTPVHFTRFHPSYRLMNVPPTPVPTLERARDAARAEGLRFVYVGNVPGHAGNHTCCPGCGAVVIRRTGMAVLENRLAKGACPDCRRAIPGIWA